MESPPANGDDFRLGFFADLRREYELGIALCGRGNARIAWHIVDGRKMMDDLYGRLLSFERLLPYVFVDLLSLSKEEFAEHCHDRLLDDYARAFEQQVGREPWPKERLLLAEMATFHHMMRYALDRKFAETRQLIMSEGQ